MPSEVPPQPPYTGPYDDKFDHEVNRVLKESHGWRWNLLAIWILLFSIAVILGLLANQHRVNDIQQSRVESCKRTYQSFKDVFKPFVSKHPTEVERARLQAFNALLDSKIQGCDKQVKPKPKDGQ